MTTPSSETIFITGGTSGIGLGLAQAYHARGAKVIIGGRNAAALEGVVAAHPGMEGVVMDVADPAAITAGAAVLAERAPGLNRLINNAGVQQFLDFGAADPPAPSAVDAEIATNLTGLINVTAALLPLLRRQPTARIVNVSSGLAFVPLVHAPVYSATKAAVHAFTVALREQLRGTGVRVVELIPPIVATNLHRNLTQVPPRAMTLDAFIREALAGLDRDRDEIVVGLAQVLRVGARVAPKRFLKIINGGRNSEVAARPKNGDVGL
jgi:uncharacterized oxidoreductase